MAWWHSLRDWYERTFLLWLDATLPEGTFLGNTAGRWLTAGGVLVSAFLLLRGAKSIVVRRARRVAERTATRWDDGIVEVLQATRNWFLLAAAIWAASLALEFPPRPAEFVRTAAVLVALLQAAFWGSALLTFAITNYVHRRMEQDAASVTTISALGFLARLALWSLVLLLMLDNLGIDVTALVAGLGVGGIAVALAAQNILGDLFASMSIVLDKPFVIGDFIVVGDFLGTVEHVGLKTTRVRSLSGEQLVFSNNDLLSSRIRNFKRMYQRRIVFGVGVTYDTPPDKLREAARVLREAVEAQEQVRFDRAHFQRFGPSSLDFEVVYFVLSPDFNLYMDIQQAINLTIVERFAAIGVEFAFPTQTIHLAAGTSVVPRTAD
ncbi:MAG: mechanosensitive ion channel family protein [Planctomycetales bacterium]